MDAAVNQHDIRQPLPQRKSRGVPLNEPKLRMARLRPLEHLQGYVDADRQLGSVGHERVGFAGPAANFHHHAESPGRQERQVLAVEIARVFLRVGIGEIGGVMRGDAVVMPPLPPGDVGVSPLYCA